MVEKLRNKFVIVTTSLMVVLFGGFLIINTIHNNYWNEVEIAEMLDWIAYSGIFTSNQIDNSRAEMIRDIMEDESPIVGVILNPNGEVLYTREIGNDNRIQIPDYVIKKIFENKGNKRKIGNYYYSYSTLYNENTLLVVMDSTMYKFSGAKIAGICIFIIGGVAALLFITFWLSKYVTEPAEKALLREKRFISDASHELKTPLGAININAQVLEMEYKDDVYVKNIISESKRMARLIEKLLTLAKLDEIENIMLSNICISDLCEEMVLTFESLAYEKDLGFKYKIEPGLHIEGDEDEIRQLLAILMDNAIKNSKEAGNIEINCFQHKKHKYILVSNEGQGIAEGDLPYIFDRFYTSDASRERDSFGLGLAIAKSIVDRHKGTIKARSVYNQNTEFEVIF